MFCPCLKFKVPNRAAIVYITTTDMPEDEYIPSIYTELEWVAQLRTFPKLRGKDYYVYVNGHRVLPRMFEAIHGIPKEPL